MFELLSDIRDPIEEQESDGKQNLHQQLEALTQSISTAKASRESKEQVRCCEVGLSNHKKTTPTTNNTNKQQTTNNKQQTTNNKQQTTNNKQQTTNNKQQTTNNKQQTTPTNKTNKQQHQQTND